MQHCESHMHETFFTNDAIGGRRFWVARPPIPIRTSNNNVKCVSLLGRHTIEKDFVFSDSGLPGHQFLPFDWNLNFPCNLSSELEASPMFASLNLTKKAIRTADANGHTTNIAKL